MWLKPEFNSIICTSIQFSSVAQSCLTLCDSMNRSTPGLPVHHQLPEFTQTHVHRVGDAIQPSHPVVPFSSCPQSLPASGFFPMSQLFAWGGQSTGVSASASVLPMNTQDWLDLLAVQGALKSLLQHHMYLASIICQSLCRDQGFPGGASGKEPTCQCRRWRRCRLNPWMGKITWRRVWQPTPVFLPGESHRQRSLRAVVHRDAKSWTWLKWLSTCREL